MNLSTRRRSGVANSRVRRAVIIAAIFAMLASTLGAYTLITATDLNPAGSGDERISLAGNSYLDDGDTFVSKADLIVNLATAGALGTTPSGVEVATPAADIRTALTAGNYAYTFEVREATVDSWSTNEDIRIRIWGYDTIGPTSTLLGTLYAQQGSADALNLEGVKATLDLASASQTYDSYNIIIDRQSEI